MRKHEVTQGETMLEIAKRWDMLPETIWQANGELSQKRKDMNVLLPGDLVDIPDAGEKSEQCATTKHHRFVLKPLAAMYRVQIFRAERPFAERKYVLTVDNRVVSDPEAKTDAKGVVCHPIPVDAVGGTLSFPLYDLTFDLRFGNLDPANEDSGWRQRLRQLGYDVGDDDEDVVGPMTKEALGRFQLRFKDKYGLDATGEPDDGTKKALEDFFSTVNEFPPLPKLQRDPLKPPAAAKAVNVDPQHTRMEIRQLEFSGNVPVENDGYPFVGPQWVKDRKHPNGSPLPEAHPLCYVRATAMVVKATFAVSKPPAAVETVVIIGTAKDPEVEFRGTVTVEPGATTATATLQAADALPDEVSFFDPLEIEWTADAAGEGPQPAGKTKHVLYLTLDFPKMRPFTNVYWTILDVSCREGKGTTTGRALMAKAWKKFKDRKIERKRNPRVLTFWNPDCPKPQADNTPGAMLNSPYGNGTCDAWSWLFIDMLNAHGVTNAHRVLVVHRLQDPKVFLDPTLGVIVTEHGFEVTTADGQGHVEAVTKQFGNHWMVQYDDKVYDPSYGIGPYLDAAGWRDVAWSHMTKTDPANPLGLGLKDDAYGKTDLYCYRVVNGQLQRIA